MLFVALLPPNNCACEVAEKSAKVTRARRQQTLTDDMLAAVTRQKEHEEYQFYKMVKK